MKGWIGTTAQALARLEKVETFDDSCLVRGAPDGEVLQNRGQSSWVVSFLADWVREPVTVPTATQRGSDMLVTADGTGHRESRARAWLRLAHLLPAAPMTNYCRQLPHPLV